MRMLGRSHIAISNKDIETAQKRLLAARVVGNEAVPRRM